MRNGRKFPEAAGATRQAKPVDNVDHANTNHPKSDECGDHEAWAGGASATSRSRTMAAI
jgi:hypothetical protein